MALAGAHVLSLLDAVGNSNAKGEYYLTDVVELARARGLGTRVVKAPESEVLGVNDRVQLAAAEAVMQARLRDAVMRAGVTLQDPSTTFLAADTIIAADVVIEPHVVIGPGVRIAAGSVIHAFSHLAGADVGENVSVGPFARLRPGTRLGASSRVGNFVETKAATVGDGAKVNHLTYIGDATIGAGANIGAGTITCNYDGFAKYRTDIGAGAFIGSNSSLVAPVTIGPGAYIASGSVITGSVTADDLAIGRARQTVKAGWAKAFRARHAKPGAK
jgi:bifunctional UDP-N-acetylglucosamine pyrophosphorylase/glucosamine-1-phosphate N-acetyltransferase